MSILIFAFLIGYTIDNMKWLNEFIVKHATGLTIFLIVIMTTWYLAGLVLVDIVHPLLFIGLWVPVGALFAWFAYKW